MPTERTVLDPDLLTIDRVRAGALAGAPITVLGLARSGIALTRFLVDAGARVTVYDGRPAIGARRGHRAARGPTGDARPRTGRRARRHLGRRRRW